MSIEGRVKRLEAIRRVEDTRLICTSDPNDERFWGVGTVSYCGTKWTRKRGEEDGDFGARVLRDLKLRGGYEIARQFYSAWLGSVIERIWAESQGVADLLGGSAGKRA